MGKKVPVSLVDKDKSYYKYYENELYPGPEEKYVLIKEVPENNETALRIENRNDLFLEGEFPVEFGWWKLENGTALIANRTFFPRVDGEMFDWWFAWHPLDRLRYACWDNEDHYDICLEDLDKAKDLSLSIQERHWGSIHHIWEDIGLGLNLLKISFKNPDEFGYDIKKIGSKHCNSIICANVIIVGDDQTYDVPVVMTHFLRPVKGGSELRSRFWFGYQIIEGEVVKCIPERVEIPSIGPISLLKHNVKEFSNLAKILPEIYKEEKDNWFA